MAAIRRETIKINNSNILNASVASAYSLSSYEGGEDKNRGGLRGGVGYLGEKAGLGFISGVEGIWDFSSGLVAKLFGADEWAERQFVNDWVNYNHADEWFNPSEGWKFAGDVAGGIGTSLPAIAGVAAGAAIAVASGGTLTPLAAGIISGSIVGLGAAGNATKEAYRESGKLSIKEFGYGALSGATEAGIELLTAGIGTGTGRIISGIAKKTSKEVTETLAKNGAKTALKNLGIDFISEGFEEGFAEAINPVYKRMTYDPSAKNASIHEITYSAIVGGISGLVMGGGNTAINTTTNIASGKKALKDGSVNSILEKSKQIAEAEGKNDTGYESFKNIKSAYEQLSQSLEKTNGEISTIRQKALLGQLKQETVRAQLMPYIERSAEKIVQNAELVAQKYSEYGLKDANGKPISVTAKDILSGIDVTADRKTYIKQLRKALTTNSVLSTLAVVDATGNITMDTAKFAEATLKAKNLADHADLEYFVTHATEAEKATVGKALGIQDWNTVSVDQFRNKVAAFAESGKLYEYATKTKQSEQNTVKTLDNDSGIRYALNKAKYISYSKIGKSQVENVRSKLKQLYSDIDSGVATEIAIEDGNTVYIVDSGKENGKINFGFRKKLVISDESLRKDFIRRRNNDSVSKGHISDGLSSKFRDEYDNGRRGDRRLETGEKLSADKGQSQNNEGRISSDNGNRGRLTSDKKALPGDENSRSDKSEATEGKSMTVIESATFAKENVPEYSQLNADDQARVRRLIRQAKANGFTDAQTRAYARVSARSGIDIVFDKERLYRGNGKYADGLYSPKQNKIFINPEGSRSPARLLIHELTHAIYNDGKGKLWLERGAKNLTKEQKEAIWNKYFPDAEFDESNIEFKDELNAHYTEALLDDDALLEKLCNDNPTLKDKILSFFKKAITGYSDEPTLSREAKKLYKRYKTLFDSFSVRNQYNTGTEKGGERFAIDDKFIELLDKWDKKTIGFSFVVGETSEALQEAGIPNKQIRWDASKIATLLKKHEGMSIDIVKKIPELLEHPILVIDSKSNPNAKIVMGELYDDNGKIVTAVLLLTPTSKKGNVLDIIKISSAEGRGHIKSLFTKDDGTTVAVRYVDKKRIQSWLNVNRLQLPLHNLDSDSTISIPQNSEKSTENAKKVSTNSGERAALPDSAIDNNGNKGYNYTKEQYEQFGWAREADALTKTELDDLYSKIQARYTLRTFKRSSKGEAIIKVNNEPHTKLGVNNVFVFVKGTKNNFKISRVVRFDAQTEVEMEIYEEDIYEGRTCSDTHLALYQREGITREYRREDFPTFAEYRERRSDGEKSRGADKDNRGPEEHGSGHSQAFGENGETTVRYALSDDDGGVHNHNKGSDKNGEEADQGRTKSANNGSYKEKSRENSNRSRIQKRMGEAQGAVRENSSAERQHRGLKNTEWLYNENNYIVPDESSELYKAQDTIKNLYGVECYVVKNSAWNRKNPACACFGKIYICENVDKYTLRTVVAHETTHVMKQQRFKPYLEFISHTIDMLNMSSKECDKLFALISNHIDVDVFNMSDEQVIRFYDELNAVVYGFENGQIFDNPNFGFNWIKDAFYDFDAYINELSKIHEQFKSRLTNNKIKETRNFEDYSNLDSVLSLDFDSASGMVHTVTKKTAKETIADGAAAMKNGVMPAVIATQIQFTNQQAGIEYAGKKMGVKDIEKWTNNARASRAQAQEMLGGKICTVRDGKIIDEGDGLGEILNPIKAKGRDYEHAFYASCYHAHNIDRMLLEKRSIERNEQNKQKLKDMQDKLNELKHDINTNNALLEKLKNSDNVNSRIETTRIREKLKSLKAEHNALNKATKKLKKTIDEFVPEANKPVLAKEINGEKVALTAEESQAILEEYDKRYPEFKQHRQKLYGYNDALMRKRVDAGLITEELYIQLKEKYPHYVPTFREQTEQGTSGISGKYNLAVKKTIGKARGSLADLMPLDKAIARMTEQTVTACNINKLVNVLVDASEAKGDTRYLEEVKRGKISLDESISKDGDDTEQDIPKTNQISAYRNGEKITYSVTPEVFAGFDAFNSKIDTASLPIKTLQWSTSVFKKLVTSLNPFFSVRNSTRDIQEAGVNTKYPKVFLKNYARAIDLIRTNSKLFQLYRAFGGLNNTVFDYEKGFTGIQNKYGFAKPDNKILSMLTAMERVNMFIEQIPRFAEFISSIEAGSSPEQAVLDAADVTTNFGRTGKITKALNSTIIPFLNPSIQGLSKITRNIRDAFTSAEAFGTFAIKLAIVGVIPQIVNYLFFKDDDDYEKLRDTDKENNYLFKVGDTFIKIPKGRVASVLAGLTNRTTQELEGKNADWKDYFDNVISQITPVENFARPIWQPVIDATNNKTWYGTKIEGQQFENTRPEDRYDESTSSIAIAMGKITKTSPKKWHYVIDQYSGIIGDILLPMTTPKAENDLIKGNFVLDPTTSNKLSTNFYKLYEEAQYKKTDGDIAAKYQVKYLNKVKKSINELYDQKAKIHQSDDLNNSEKLQQARIIQALINTLYQDVMDNYDSYTKAIAMTQGYYDEETEEDIRQAEITRIVYGSKQALKEYNEKVYEKCELLNLAGVDYDKLYYYYFSTKGLTSDTDKKGNVISGSKKKKVIAAVNALGVSREQMLLLIASKGYSLTDSEKKRLLSYILKLKTTKEKRIELAELCGFTVRNGKIVANFK